MNVIELPLGQIIPYARNPRRNDKAVVTVAASIAEFGWRQPIVVDEAMVVLAGHTRLEAARQLGLETAPVHVAKGLSEAQARAFRIMDNRSSENAEWDNDLLGLELGDLLEAEFDLGMTGFTDDELNALLSGVEAETAEDADDVPDAPEDPVSRLGDLWLLGPHRLLCGDATVATDVQRLLGEAKANICFCDPPYNVDYAGGVGAEKAGKGRRIKNDALGDGFGQFLYDACALINTHTSGAVYICMSSSELATLQKAFTEAGGHWSTFIIWAKDRFTLGRADYQRQYEPILYGWPEGTKRRWCGARNQGDVWLIDRPAKNDLHPTMKPVALVERALRNSSRKGDLVFDPFGGSVTADGAYDTRKCHEAIAARGAHAEIPPRKNAKPWKPTSAGAIARNEAVSAQQYLGRTLWRRWSGYHCRSRVETKMHCMKLLGQSLMARDFDRQVAEIHVRIAVLNRYTALGIPVTEPVG